MGVEIGNAAFGVKDGDRIKIGLNVELLIYKRSGRSGLQILVQAPKEMNIKLVKRVVKAARAFAESQDTHE